MKCLRCETNEAIVGLELCSDCEGELRMEEQAECPHKKTVAINEEGHAGVYCSDCGEQVEREC